MLDRLMGAHVSLTVHEPSEVAWVAADPGQIEQVVMNLTLNARDAMPGGGTIVIETGEVIFEAATAVTSGSLPAGVYITLTVRDSGSGMDAATVQRIFEPFFTTKELGLGTGLGLATVHGAVQQSGGEIAVTSAPGMGSAFTVYLPRTAGPPLT